MSAGLWQANGLASSTSSRRRADHSGQRYREYATVVTATGYVRQEIGRSYGQRPIQDYILAVARCTWPLWGCSRRLRVEYGHAGLCEAIDYFSANPDEVLAAITPAHHPGGNS